MGEINDVAMNFDIVGNYHLSLEEDEPIIFRPIGEGSGQGSRPVRFEGLEGILDKMVFVVTL